MSSPSVWVQLYYKGEETDDRDPVEISPIPRNIGALKAAVLPELGPALLGEVKVYAPGTGRPFSEQISIRGDKKVLELIDEAKEKTPPFDYDHPLIVVAPAPAPHPPGHGPGQRRTPSMSFTTWLDLPNGTGVRKRTALPQKKLVSSLLSSSDGVYWMESPPSSGKTAIGQILEEVHGWQYLNLHDENDMKLLDALDTGKLQSHCFIDEAQSLVLKHTRFLRGAGAKGYCFVCAGVSGAPIPTCKTCESTGCRVCVKCWSYECLGHTEGCAEGVYEKTNSMVVAEEDSRRFTVDNLAACPEELEFFLGLFFKGSNLCQHIPRGLAENVAKSLAPPFVQITGGLMSYIITAIRCMYDQQKCWRGFTITDTTLHASEILAKLNDPTVIRALRDVRLKDDFDDANERAALVSFLRDYKGERMPIVEPYATSLQKKALVRRCPRGCIPWSPLVFDILTYNLLYQKGHQECSFTENSVDSMVKHIVEHIKKDYQDRVYQGNNLKHEDEINSAIASILKNALGRVGLHRGPAKQSTKGEYSQVDHAIYWLAETAGPTIIETCLRNVPEHVSRFGATGNYTKNYQYGSGVVLVWNKTKNPQPPNLPNGGIPSRVYLYHVNVPSYSMKKYVAASKSWIGVESPYSRESDPTR